MPYIVELEPGVWLASDFRCIMVTSKRGDAMRYTTWGSAERAMYAATIRPPGKFRDAKIEEVKL